MIENIGAYSQVDYNRGYKDAIEIFYNRIEKRFDEAREQGIEIDMCNIDIIRKDIEDERI